MRANFSMALLSLFQEIGFSETSQESTTIIEILNRTGLDSGLPINISTGVSEPLIRIERQVEYNGKAATFLEAIPIDSKGMISLDSSARNLLVPGEVVSSSISKYISSGAAAFVEFSVIDTVSSPEGKWPTSFGNVVAIEASQIGIFVEEMVQAAFSSDAFKEILIDDLYPFGGLTEVIAKEIRERFLALLRELRIESSASLVGIQMKNRTSAYAESRQTARQSLAQFTDLIGERIGADATVTLMTPLLLTFEELSFLRTFLYQFSIIIVLGVTAIGCLVLWTVAFSEVQELLYITSVMRTLGLSKTLLSLFRLILSMRHSLFGICLGAALTAVGTMIISEVLSSSLEVPLRAEANIISIVIAVLLGALLPTIGSILPSRRARTTSLKPQRVGRDPTEETFTVAVHRLKDVGCNVWIISASILLTVYGAAFYFFLPRSFLDENYSMFFGILNLSMTGLIVGLAAMFQTGQEVSQYALIEIFIFLAQSINLLGGRIIISERCLLTIVLRNMKNHRRQNRNAAIVLSLSTAVMVFFGSFTELQVDGASDSVRESLGSDMVLLAKTRANPLNETQLRLLMANLSGQHTVERFSFITFPLSEKVQIMSMSGWPKSEPLEVYGVDDQFFETIDGDITKLSETLEHPSQNSSLYALLDMYPDNPAVQKEAVTKPSCISKTGRKPTKKGIIPPDQNQPWIYERHSNKMLDGSETLSEVNLKNLRKAGGSSGDEEELPSYEVPGVTNNPILLLISEAFRETLSLDTATPLNFKVKSLNLVAHASIMAQKLPSFFFSRFASTLSLSPVLISDRNFRRLSAILETGWTFEQNPAIVEKVSLQQSTPKQRLLIRLNSSSSQSIARSRIWTLKSDNIVVRDMEENLMELQGLKNVLGSLYAGVAILLSFLTASMLWVVFHENAKQNTWTVALSRALGLADVQVLKIQLYECFAVTIFGISSGTAIGLLATFALVLQDELFRGIRQRFKFPHAPFVVLSLMCFSTAFLSSIVSWKKMIRCEAANLLRNSEY